MSGTRRVPTPSNIRCLSWASDAYGPRAESRGAVSAQHTSTVDNAGKLDACIDGARPDGQCPRTRRVVVYRGQNGARLCASNCMAAMGTAEICQQVVCIISSNFEWTGFEAVKFTDRLQEM